MEAAAYPKSRKVRYANSVIGIPVDGKLIQTAVLWHSSSFKNVILIAPTDQSEDLDSDSKMLGEPLGLFFTGAQIIRAGHWKFQGPAKFDVPTEVITFECAQTIYCGDEPIRATTSSDRAMELLVFGGVAVTNAVSDILSGNYDSQNHRIAQRIVAAHLMGLLSNSSRN